jgi:hypothetical protein
MTRGRARADVALSERHVAAGGDEERLARVEHAPKLLAEGRVHLTR